MFYAGLDVSLKRTSVCVVDAAGKVVKECSILSDPDTIAAVLSGFRERLERIGLEAGVTAAWLHRGLCDSGFPVIVIDAAHATAAVTKPTETTRVALPISCASTSSVRYG